MDLSLPRGPESWSYDAGAPPRVTLQEPLADPVASAVRPGG